MAALLGVFSVTANGSAAATAAAFELSDLTMQKGSTGIFGRYRRVTVESDVRLAKIVGDVSLNTDTKPLQHVIIASLAECPRAS